VDEPKYEMMGQRVLFRKRILRESHDGLRETEGGIFIPDGAQSHEEGPAAQGEILACGPGRERKDGSRVPMTVKAGDLIVYNEQSAMKLDPSAKGDRRDLRIINEKDILATTDKPVG
tara:strand:- start:1639 stop:1989 length:351 start_codon:yes stop_codon:yes gene_type:complete